MSTAGPQVRIDLTNDERDILSETVTKTVENCPGQTESRYLAFVRSHVDSPVLRVRGAYEAGHTQPLLLANLPHFEDVEKTKILALILGQTIGSCVGYADYNGSYITDIRPTELSSEKSSGTDLLAMHNDLAWASDGCRPRTLVLTPHVAEGAIPKTLLAPADEVVAHLSAEANSTLRKPHFEARSGSSLGWRYERVARMPLIEVRDGRLFVRLNFSAFSPVAGLSDDERDQALGAHEELSEVALTVGRERGHAVLKGEALIIPNDHCLHGRDPMDSGSCERLLLRSYVVPDAVVRERGRTMISLEF